MRTGSVVFNSLKRVRGLFKAKNASQASTRIGGLTNNVWSGTSRLGLTDEAWSNISRTVFRDSTAPKSGFLAYLQDFETTLKNNSLTMPEDVQKAYSTLSEKANMFADRMSAAIAKGKTPQHKLNKPHDYFEKFQEIYSEEFKTLEKYLNKQTDILSEQVCSGKCKIDKWNEFNNLKTSLRDLYDYHLGDLYDPRITALGPNIISPTQYLYHGTHAQRQILKKGFSLVPKASQAEAGARELGKAVYLTPDREVASFFAGLRGNIIKTQADVDKIAVLNFEQSNLINREFSRIFRYSSSDPVKSEELITELFRRNGYDAIYTRGSLNDGIGKILGGDIDKFIGRPQSQIAIFDPSRITICEKTANERLSNQVLQAKTRFHFIKGLLSGFIS